MSAGPVGGLLARLRQPRTWATLLVLLVVGGLYLFSEYGGQDGDTAPHARQSAQATAAPSSTAPSNTATVRPSERASARTTARPSPPRRSDASPTQRPTQRSTRPAGQERDRTSGLVWIDASDLPREGQQTLVAIDNGGPFVRSKDGTTFGNYEGVLPARPRGHYREYTVPTPGIDHAGPRRIVTGGSGEFYWTADHYASFERIRR